MKNLMLALILSFIQIITVAHSGGTNSNGCHNDNVNGGYHCHNSQQIIETTTNSEVMKEKSEIKREISSCCKICRKGKACGDSCISRSYTCTKPSGCACDG